MRVDANISIERDGFDSAVVEIKNINSLNYVRRAINGEIDRQRRVLSSGGTIESETRSLLDDNESSGSMRAKGEELDYRIIPEPNLPRLIIEKGWIKEANAQVSTDLKHLKYINEYNIPPQIALDIVVR